MMSAPATDQTIEAKVLEVLAGLGMAHLLSEDGTVYGINRQTPGVVFDELRPGQRVRCEVTRRFGRVIHATLVE